MKLENKVVVLTGAASGIGKAMARLFAEHGAKQVLADVDEERLEKIVAELTESGAKAVAAKTDVSEKAQVEAMLQTAVDQFGRIDVLCNNAGIIDNLAPLGETDDDLWDRVQRINVNGPFYAMRAVLPTFLEQGAGVIVNTASAASTYGGRGGASYTASKHALAGLTRSVAWYYGPKGVRCNAVAPGAIKTPMASGGMPNMGGLERMQPYFPTVPPRGEAMEIAQAALYLASDDSSYVNGAILAVDGGWTVF